MYDAEMNPHALTDDESTHPESDELHDVKVSRQAMLKRAQLQRDLFGSDEEDGEEMWDFDGTEWVRAPANGINNALGDYPEIESVCTSIFSEVTTITAVPGEELEIVDVVE